jgi:hypothetical protein
MMKANDVIESYVTDVAAQLPRKQRNDVAFELRALLQDELAASAAEQDRPADKAMAMFLVSGFGRPAETAARYAPRHPVIDPADNHNLLIWAIVGAVLLQGSNVSWLAWMGALLLIFASVSWSRRRWPVRFAWRPRRYRDPDAANRLGFAAAAACTIIFPLAMYVAPSTFVHTLLLGAVPVSGLSLTPAFVDSWQRIAVVVGLIVAAGTYAGIAMQGRFRRWSRGTQIIVNLWLGLLLVMHASPMAASLSGVRFTVFTSAMANQSAAPFFLLAGAICLLGALYEAYREWARVRPAPPTLSVA